MLSKQDAFNAAFVLFNIVVLYYVLVQVYGHLVLMILIYIGYRFIQVQVEENIDIAGKGVLITGCDTGFGHELALRLESLGCTVYAGCLLPKGDGVRKLSDKNSNRMHVLHLDVTNDSHVTDAVQYVRKHSKDTGLWAVVNNAGIERIADIELSPTELMKRVAEVNFYGMVRITKAFIPIIRKSKGRIVNVSSIGGRIAVPSHVNYCVTKYAVEAFSDILRREMYKFDVNVSIIEPSQFAAATAVFGKGNCDLIEREIKDLWKNLPSESQAVYGWEYLSAQIEGCRKFGVLGCTSTIPVTDAMVDALINTCPKSRYLIHGGSKWFDIWAILTVLSSYLPDSIMDFLIANLHPSPKLAAETKL